MTTAYAVASPTAPFARVAIQRRDPTPCDVQIEILFCGICHSDLHQARNEWSGMPTAYPCVPGHEIVGRVTGTGARVSRFKRGDLVGVGCLVDSDGTCPECRDHHEQFCPSAVFTYNGADRHGAGPVTYGGYSDRIVVDERFVLRVPENLDPAGAAPLLCAGITTWSPLRRQGVGPGKTVGVVGLGGLGHMGVKLARAMGAHVVVFSTTPAKAADALRLGAHEVVGSKDPAAMARQAGRFDMILDTVSAVHDLHPYLACLKREGNLTLVGAPDQPHAVSAFGLIFGNKTLSGSLIGGIQATQEMLDFCGEHGITADVEVIPVQRLDEAYRRLLASDVRYRFSIDMASLRAGA